MKPTLVEKIQCAMLCELAKPPEDRKLKFDAIRRAIFNEDLWVFDRHFFMFEFDVPIPPEVRTVENILHMWYSIESWYDKLDEPEKKRVSDETYMPDGLRFPGFFQRRMPNERHRIAKVIVEDIGFLQEFKGRLNGPYPVRGYDRMLAAWNLLQGIGLTRGEMSLKLNRRTVDDLIHVVRERIPPEEREVGADGRWTPSDDWNEGFGNFD